MRWIARPPLAPRGAALLAALGALAATAACREPTVALRLRFPSEEAFLLSNTITVDVYDGSGRGERSPDAICRALSVQSSVAPAGVQALESSGNTSACAVLDGGVIFRSVAVGRRVFFAEAVDRSGAAILRGCSVADVFGDDEGLEGLDEGQQLTAEKLGATSVVDVQLATLPSYPDDTTPTCESVAAKCEENQACVR
jgi:hypothetical protein